MARACEIHVYSRIHASLQAFHQPSNCFQLATHQSPDGKASRQPDYSCSTAMHSAAMTATFASTIRSPGYGGAQYTRLECIGKGSFGDVYRGCVVVPAVNVIYIMMVRRGWLTGSPGTLAMRLP